MKQVQVYNNPVVTLSRPEVARVNYMGLRSWALQGIIQARKMPVPFAAHPIAVRESITDAVSIMAAHALASPLGKLEVMETCGRIVLVAVEEQRAPRDPIIPLALVNLGDRYNKAFAKYVRHLARYSTEQRWWNRAYSLCGKVIKALEEVAGALAAEELSYLVMKIQVPLAWPTGRAENPYG